MIYTGQSLKYLRMSKGLTQKEIAEKLYVAQNTLSDYENEIVVPDMITFQKWIATLGYNLQLSHKEQRFPDRAFPRIPDFNFNKAFNMFIVNEPYDFWKEEQAKSIDSGEVSSIWEMVQFLHKTTDDKFFQNDVISTEGLICVRLYKERGSYVVQKAIFKENELVEVTDEWATLKDINDNIFLYLKYRNETEKLIATDDSGKKDEELTDLGHELFTDYIFEKHLMRLAGEL